MKNVKRKESNPVIQMLFHKLTKQMKKKTVFVQQYFTDNNIKINRKHPFYAL